MQRRVQDQWYRTTQRREIGPRMKIVRNQPELYMQRVRRSPAKSFEARYADTCNSCHQEIEVGQMARYSDLGIVHARHSREDSKITVCDRCWLTKPCECEED